MSKKELVIEFLESLDEDVKVAIWNEYCESTNRMDDYIERMDEIELLGGVEDVLSRIDFDNFRYSDSYFWFDGYGNIVSSDWPTENIDWDEVADDFLANWDDIADDFLADVSRGWKYFTLTHELSDYLAERRTA